MKRFTMDDAPLLFATKDSNGKTELLSFQFTPGSTVDYKVIVMLKAHRDMIANRIVELLEAGDLEENYDAYVLEIARLGIEMSNVLLGQHCKLPNFQFDEFGNLELDKPNEKRYPATLENVQAFAIRDGFPTLD